MPKTLPGQYRRFPGHASNEDITSYFVERYGYAPRIIKRTPDGVIVGPLHSGEELQPGEHIVTGGNYTDDDLG